MGEYHFVHLEYILSFCFRQARNLQVNTFDGLEVRNSFPFFIPEDGDRVNQYIMHIFIHAMGKVQRKYARDNIKPLSQTFRNGLYFISF